ncbi:MAG: hypothetical protein KZQ83_09750 [gamma proteobacterium symbiont of Taylorina sp.]|nr:hypothetical protein [gamma proteobacterium symbiont of Taylorina sp.]
MSKSRSIIIVFFALLSFSLFFSRSVLAEPGFKVFQTQQPAQNLIAILAPLYGQSARFTAKNNTLIIKAPAQILFEIEQLLQEIDQPLINLLIEVSHSFIENESLQNNDIGYNRSDAKIQSIHTRRKSSNKTPDIFKIRTVEGQWSAIQIGQKVPYYSMQGNWNHRWQNTTHLEDVTSGFDVFPILNGNQVTLKVRPHNDSMSKQNADWINTRSLNTSITGRLGQWLYLGGAATEDNAKNISSGISYENAKIGGTRYSTKRYSDLEMDYSIRVNLIE